MPAKSTNVENTGGPTKASKKRKKPKKTDFFSTGTPVFDNPAWISSQYVRYKSSKSDRDIAAKARKAKAAKARAKERNTKGFKEEQAKKREELEKRENNLKANLAHLMGKLDIHFSIAKDPGLAMWYLGLIMNTSEPGKLKKFFDLMEDKRNISSEEMKEYALMFSKSNSAGQTKEGFYRQSNLEKEEWGRQQKKMNESGYRAARRKKSTKKKKPSKAVTVAQLKNQKKSTNKKKSPAKEKKSTKKKKPSQKEFAEQQVGKMPGRK